MQTLLYISSVIIICQSATILPRIDSSSVNVHQSGPDFSYTIRENHEVGVGVEPIHLPPLVKIIPHEIGNIVHHQQQQQQQRQSIQQQTQQHQQSVSHDQPQTKQQEPLIRDHQIQPIEPQVSSQIRQEIHLPLATVPAILPAYQYTYPVGINYPYNLIATF